MSATINRDARGNRQRMMAKVAGIAVLSVMAIAIVAAADGFSAAAGERTAESSADLTPVVLAGRWKGPRYSFNLRAADAQSCNGKPCELTYDIVVCAEGWCGIAVTDDQAFGRIGLRLNPNAAKDRRNAFTGKLELAKGSAPYTVEAWYAPPGEREGEGHQQAHLSFVGDTGPELLMMRRSFPFQAELTRVSDAQCTLEKATS